MRERERAEQGKELLAGDRFCHVTVHFHLHQWLATRRTSTLKHAAVSDWVWREGGRERGREGGREGKAGPAEVERFELDFRSMGTERGREGGREREKETRNREGGGREEEVREERGREKERESARQGGQRGREGTSAVS